MKGVGGNWKAETDDLERVIEKSDTSSSINSDELIKSAGSIREQLVQVIHSGKFQIAVISLVVLDCLLVIGELLIDLKVFENSSVNGCNVTGHATPNEAQHLESGPTTSPHEETEKKESSLLAAEILHYLSITILSIFLVELCLKLFAMGKSFFHHKMEMLDAVIVIVSFALDIAFIDTEGINSAVHLLVILRLWRVGRVVNGVCKHIIKLSYSSIR